MGQTYGPRQTVAEDKNIFHNAKVTRRSGCGKVGGLTIILAATQFCLRP